MKKKEYVCPQTMVAEMEFEPFLNNILSGNGPGNEGDYAESRERMEVGDYPEDDASTSWGSMW